MRRKKRNNIFVDIHVLQSVPASCMNRDDTNQPKSEVYGGKTRGRVSSQAWKHVVRKYFEENFVSEKGEWTGKRTLAVGDITADIIAELDPEIENPFIAAEDAFAMAGIEFGNVEGDKSTDRGTDALFFLSLAQANAIAEKAVGLYHWKKSFLALLVDENGNELVKEQIENTKAALKARKELKDSIINNAFEAAGFKKDKKEKTEGKKSECLLPKETLDKLSLLAAESSDYTKKAFEMAINEKPSFDMILFGRMFAKNPNLDIDACCQVAHSVTTHAVKTEYDTFTAVDDCQRPGAKGAAMLGENPYISGTFYRFASVNVQELAEKIADAEIGDIVAGFAEAFVRTIPQGKINTFANYNPPDYVYITVRDDCPFNFANAFERPVTTSSEGYLRPSEVELEKYAKNGYEKYAHAPIFAVSFDLQGDGPDLAVKLPLDDALNSLAEFVNRRLAEQKAQE